jgi:hypothetical protein
MDQIPPSLGTPPSLDPRIAPTDFQRYLKAFNIKGICIECGANEWNFFGVQENGTPAVLILEEPARFPGTYIPCVVLVCKNCGNIRSFARKVVLAWLERNPK